MSWKHPSQRRQHWHTTKTHESKRLCAQPRRKLTIILSDRTDDEDDYDVDDEEWEIVEK